MASDRDALRQWSQLHDGYDVDGSRLVRGWLLVMHRLAVPLARWRVPPNVLTFAGVATAAAAVVTGRLASVMLVLVTSVCDGLDGAVAIQRGRSSRHGTLIDHAADRLTDVLFAAVLWHAGADVWAVVADAALVLSYESARSLIRRRGVEHARVTVGERPIRVAVTVIGIAVAPTVGAAVVALLCVAALIQVLTIGAGD